MQYQRIKSAIKSDHSALIVYEAEQSSIIINKRKQFSSERNLHRLMLRFLLLLMNGCWKEVESIDDMQEATDRFYKITSDILNHFYPQGKITVTNTGS